jgi:hypothetical protein
VATAAEDKLAAVMNALADPGVGNYQVDISPASGTIDDETAASCSTRASS